MRARSAMWLCAAAAVGCSHTAPSGPGTDTDTDVAEIPDVSGIWVVTQESNGSFETRLRGDATARATGECVMRASGGGPWRLTITQDGSNATAEVSARQLSCEGQDTSPDTPTDGVVRLSETFEGFTVGIRFGADGTGSLVPHSACMDAAFTRASVTSCTWSESISISRNNGGDISGTFTVRLDYTNQSTRRIYDIIRGTLIAEWIGPPP